jgi:hypothetical protein
MGEAKTQAQPNPKTTVAKTQNQINNIPPTYNNNKPAQTQAG